MVLLDVRVGIIRMHGEADDLCREPTGDQEVFILLRFSWSHMLSLPLLLCPPPHPLCRTWIWCTCSEDSLAVLSELRHRYHVYPSFLTLDLGVLICGPPWEVVTVCHPPILVECMDWWGVGLGTSPCYPLANHLHTPVESILLGQTG